MQGRLGLLAFGGGLPREIVSANPDCHVVTFETTGADLGSSTGHLHRFDALDPVIAELRAAGVDRVVFAGALGRPEFSPRPGDVAAARIAAQLANPAVGDDQLVRCIIAVFEGAGLSVVGAHQVAPALVSDAGMLAGREPDAAQMADAYFARDVLIALGPHDIGQAAVVAGGRCLGIETLGGTDAMLAGVAALPDARRHAVGGVLVKMPKPGQDLRVDMPAIGPTTVETARRAGLAGIVICANRVLVLAREQTLSAVQAAGMFLTAEDF